MAILTYLELCVNQAVNQTDEHHQSPCALATKISVLILRMFFMVAQ